MARFKYRMQSILNVKYKLEDQAKMEFASAQSVLTKEEASLKSLQQRKKDYEEEAEKLRRGNLNVRDMKDNRNALNTMDDFIEIQQQRDLAAQADVQKAGEKLTRTMQERKMHEKLKENAFQDFLSEEKHNEGKEVDELTSYTYGQRIKNADGQ